MHARLPVFLFLFTCFSTPLLSATEKNKPLSLPQQITKVGHLSSLAHRIVRGMCLTQMGIDARQNSRTVNQAKSELDKAFKLLLKGDRRNNIAAIQNAAIRDEIDIAKKEWRVLKGALDRFLIGAPVTDQDLAHLSYKADQLETLWGNVSEALEKRPEAQSGAGLSLDIQILRAAADQSRLLEKAGKEACVLRLLTDDIEIELHAEALLITIEQFHENSFDLAFRYPGQSVPILQHAEVESRSFSTWMDWISLESHFEEAAGQEISEQEIYKIALKEMSFGIEFLGATLRENVTYMMAPEL